MSSAGPLHSYVNEQFSSNRCLYLPARRTGTSPWGGPETRHREGSPNLVDADTSGTAGGRGRTTSKGTAEVGVTPPRIGISWSFVPSYATQASSSGSLRSADHASQTLLGTGGRKPPPEYTAPWKEERFHPRGIAVLWERIAGLLVAGLVATQCRCLLLSLSTLRTALTLVTRNPYFYLHWPQVPRDGRAEKKNRGEN